MCQALVSIYLEEKGPAKQQPHGYDFSGSAKDAAQALNVGSGSTSVGILCHKLRLLVDLKPENVIIVVENRESNGLEFGSKMLRKRSYDLRVLVLGLTIKDHTVPIQLENIGFSSQISQYVSSPSWRNSAHGDVRVEVPHVVDRVTLSLVRAKTQVEVSTAVSSQNVPADSVERPVARRLPQV